MDTVTQTLLTTVKAELKAAVNNNDTFFKRLERELPESTFYWFLISLVAGITWVVYLTYYNSRIMGHILTVVLNKFIKYGHIKFGSFSFSVLTGKIMFRDVHFITEDFSLRITDGYVIFRWWRPYIYKEQTEDLSHSDTRLSIFLDEFEFHVYNRSSHYARLERLFGLETLIQSYLNTDDPHEESDTAKRKTSYRWRDLVPVIKLDIGTGRCVFGNNLVPTTLVLSFEEGHVVYTTKPPSTPFDKFMHITKCTAENFRVLLVPSPKYEGPVDQPPRRMGEGFAVLQTSDIDIYFYRDEAGTTTHEPQRLQLAEGDYIVSSTHPCLGVDIKCGKSSNLKYGKTTDISYGPWADRQREYLWKFFYPADYQTLEVSKDPLPGQPRNYKTFDIRMSMISGASIDILFTKDKETQAIHMIMSQGTYLETNIPWLTSEDGYTSKVNGQLLRVEASTSLEYRSFFQAETLEFNVEARYPKSWNGHQDWIVDLTACKATIWFIFHHKEFIMDILDEWSDKNKPDIFKFVPYTWQVNFIIKEFELVTLANEYNWIDCSSTHTENAHIAVCGEKFDMSFTLPYTDFLPPTVPVNLFIGGESCVCRMYLPDTNTSHYVLKALSENMKLMDRDGAVMDQPYIPNSDKQWRNVTKKSNGWVDCWFTPIIGMNIVYVYYPAPPLRDLEMFESEESKLLYHLRHVSAKDSGMGSDVSPVKTTPLKKVAPDDFDPTIMEPDLITLELEVGPSNVYLYGTLLRNFLNVKENYLGEDQTFTDFENFESSSQSEVDTTVKDFDARNYRPLSVNVSLTLHDLHAHAITHCTSEGPPCPSLFIERIGFELDKSYEETKLQVLLSPTVLVVKDSVQRSIPDSHLNDGHIALSGLQVRGHAMFSHRGLPLNSDTLEYAWLIEATVGDITGKITLPQLDIIVNFLKTSLFLIEDSENVLQRPLPYQLCQHFIAQDSCEQTSNYSFPCPTSEAIKYRLTRASVDCIDLYLCEEGSAMNLQVYPVRASTCNLHGENNEAGLTAIIQHIHLKQYIKTPSDNQEASNQSDIWLEAGGLSFGPINLDVAMALPFPEFHEVQDTFLKVHDTKSKRLWFLWSPDEYLGNPATVGKCGCLGGCKFFGNNKNGIGFFNLHLYESSAVYKVYGIGEDPGFGQSLLQQEQLVFDVKGSASPTKAGTPFRFTRGYMSRASPESLITDFTDLTLVDQLSYQSSAASSVTINAARVNAEVHQIDDVSNIVERGSLSESEDASNISLCGSIGNNIAANTWTSVKRAESFLSDTGSIPSEFLPDSDIPDAYDTDRWASSQSDIPSETDVSSLPRYKLGRQESHSTQSSNYSPQLRRTASDRVLPVASPSRLTSMSSLGESEYYSADEEMSDNTLPRLARGHKLLERQLNVTMLHKDETDLLAKIPTEQGTPRTIIERSLRERSRILDSSSDDASVSSFVSAVSYQKDTEADLIDLTSQMNKPVTQSPLLMNCYTSHLTQLKVNNWSKQMSLPHVSLHPSYNTLRNSSFHSQHTQGLNLQDRRPSVDESYCPYFIPTHAGFSTALLVDRQAPFYHHNLHATLSPQETSHKKKTEKEANAEHGSSNDDHCNKTTAIVKFKGSLDVLVSPLMLEAVQRYVEAVTPMLCNVHLNSILDKLHIRTSDSLKSQNKIKKKKSAKEAVETRLQKGDVTWTQENEGQKTSFEETQLSRIQIMFELSKVNVCFLQASIVEEKITLEALDNFRDLTCVSLLSLCLDSVSCQLMSSNKSVRRVEMRPHTATTTSRTKKQNISKTHLLDKVEMVIDMDKESSVEESVGNISVTHVHCQLRRLKKGNHLGNIAMLTAIPESKSRVLFGVTKEISEDDSSSHKTSSMDTPIQKLYGIKTEGAGYIMCECGLENITIIAARRTGSELNVIKSTDEETKLSVENEKDPQHADDNKSLSGSYRSRISIASSQSTESVDGFDLKGDATSCNVELRTLWFSFAAPPQTKASKRKMKFTRLDWNLLSTATPAINAWLNPTELLTVSVKTLMKGLEHRACAVLAAMMTEALDVQTIHVLAKSKYNKITSMSRALQEDPTCQLITALRRYSQTVDIKSIEGAVHAEHVPQVLTLQKGLLVLIRQWKSVLYAPVSTETSFKGRKGLRPYTVSFALPTDVGLDNTDEELEETSLDNMDTADETAHLLEGNLTIKDILGDKEMQHNVKEGNVEHISKLKGILVTKDNLDDSAGQFSSLAVDQVHKSKPSLSRNESHTSFHTGTPSMSSFDVEFGTPSKSFTKRLESLDKGNENENLYLWMVRQQEYNNRASSMPQYAAQESVVNMGSEISFDEQSQLDMSLPNYMIASAVQPADAQVLFSPFLKALGIHTEDVKSSPLMKKFGGSLSVSFVMPSLKVDIIDSELEYKQSAKGKGKGKGKRKLPRITVNNVTPDSAFHCEMFSVGLDVKDVADFNKENNTHEQEKHNKTFPFTSLTAKPTTTQLNVMLSCNSMTQHVNMPLLRLAIQVASMFENVQDTREKLKNERESDDIFKTHTKHDSGSSGTDTQSFQNERWDKQPTPSPISDTFQPFVGSPPSSVATKSKPHKATPIPIQRRPEKLSFTLEPKSPRLFSLKKRLDFTPLKTGIGYTPLQEMVTIEIPDATTSPTQTEKTIVDEITESTPKCWRNLYHLIDIYSHVPTAKMVERRRNVARLPAIAEETDVEIQTPQKEETAEKVPTVITPPRRDSKVAGLSVFTQKLFVGESIVLVVFGVAKLKTIHLLANISGINLKADLLNVHASATYKEKVKGVIKRRSLESSLSSHIGQTFISLSEAVGPTIQTVVNVNIAKSEGLYSTLMKHSKDHNNAMLNIGKIEVSIPQHPVTLHSMVSRSSRRLSNTLQEFLWSGPTRSRSSDSVDRGSPVQASSHIEPDIAVKESVEPTPVLVVHLTVILKGLSVGASLLPSLKAQYIIGKVTGSGVTGNNAKFTVDWPDHKLAFNSQVTDKDSSVPSSASIDLPPIYLCVEHLEHSAKGESTAEGLLLRQGSYFHATADVGAFEHQLTTDLLNHLVFAQKVFMKEINEILQKVAGGEQPVPLWNEQGQRITRDRPTPILYVFLIRLKGIQITATTPTSIAVRLETSAIDLELSNRVLTASKDHSDVKNMLLKMFVKLELDLNVSLGQVLINTMYGEAEPDLVKLSFFATRIGLRNALQDEMILEQTEEQEALLITLSRPIVFVQPVAFDKAVLVWLNYKNAYEYWNEQRMSLNNEIQTATQQVLERLPVMYSMAPSSSNTTSTLFLQLTVDDLGICLPLNNTSQGPVQTSKLDTEPGSALVLTLQSTQISACSKASLVSKGHFTGFCLRFEDDFQTSWDDWKPERDQFGVVMNACVVPEGTYEVCSRTLSKQSSDANSNAKWILNILWKMKGLDMHIDPNIGPKISSLFSSPTALTGEDDDMDDEVITSADDIDGALTSQDVHWRKVSHLADDLPSFVFDTAIEDKTRARMIGEEINNQAKLVQDLKTLGASRNTIQCEEKKLSDLESLVFQDFRRDVIKRIKKQSEKATALKDKLGLGYKPATHYRSKSINTPIMFGRSVSTSDPPQGLAGRELSRHSLPPISHTRALSLDVNQSDDTIVLPKADSPTESEDILSRTIDVTTFHEDLDDELKDVSKPIRSQSLQDMADESSGSEKEDEVELGYFKHISDRLKDVRGAASPSLGSGGSQKTAIIQTPTVDFECDVKVDIDSGQCVLHPKSDTKEDADIFASKRPHQGKGSFTNRSMSVPSPPTVPKRRIRKMESAGTLGSGKQTYRQGSNQSNQQESLTIFYVPGVDVKVQYSSYTDYSQKSPGNSLENNVDPSTILQYDTTDGSSSMIASKKLPSKKANLYAWLSLQSLPEEMVVTPSLLDFLEKALEPIPIQPQQHKLLSSASIMGSMLALNLEENSGTLTPPTIASYTSFPVDVVVYISVQPSTIRFNCLPISKVECILQVPSLDFIISTERSDKDLTEHNGTPPVKTKFPKPSSSKERHSSGPRNRPGSNSRHRVASASDVMAEGGLSMTGCLTNFSLYIFHPYGGQRSGMTTHATTSRLEAPLGNIKESSSSSSLLDGSRRKDSLSLNVEFIKLNISRSRKTFVSTQDSLMGSSQSSAKLVSDRPANVVRFSTVCDVGSAQFKYDMRRLSEILAFPKAWYNRALARRLFLGDESLVHQPFSGSEDSLSGTNGSISPLSPDTPGLTHSSRSMTSPVIHLSHTEEFSVKPTHHRRSSSGDKSKIVLNDNSMKQGRRTSLPKLTRSAVTPTLKLTMPSPVDGSTSSRPNTSTPASTSVSRLNTWETLVLFAVNLSTIDVHVNMGNVMGNTVWSTEGLQSSGHLSIDSIGHKNLKITASLGGTKLDAKSGIVGCSIDVKKSTVSILVNEDQDKEPDHRHSYHISAIEMRLDYMGSSILMARINDLELLFRDDWHLDMTTVDDLPLVTKRAVSVFVLGDLKWNQFHMIISKSTTPDLIKMATKLNEYFDQQLTSSKRAFAVYGNLPGPAAAAIKRFKEQKNDTTCPDNENFDVKHHRHWQKVLHNIAGCQLPMMSSLLPETGTIVGGALTLRGSNLSLACFHGINFRSKSWALFVMKEPAISFSTEVQEVLDNGSRTDHVVQNFDFVLGTSGSELSDRHLATISKLSRGYHVPPPLFTSVHEWFLYAFGSSRDTDLDDFTMFSRAESGTEHRKRKSVEYGHETEIIFALPSLQLHLKTEHLQAENKPTPDDPKAQVEVSFVTEFDNHIYVAMDAEVILFLHDLVTSYVREKDKGTKSSFKDKTRDEDKEDKKKLTDPTSELKKDWREFNCKTWHLEPTVRLLSWAGKRIEPVGVDYILQKLGFTHARSTIPKWMQRGAMDPLDAVLAILVNRLILEMKENKDKSDDTGKQG